MCAATIVIRKSFDNDGRKFLPTVEKNNMFKILKSVEWDPTYFGDLFNASVIYIIYTV